MVEGHDRKPSLSIMQRCRSPAIQVVTFTLGCDRNAGPMRQVKWQCLLLESVSLWRVIVMSFSHLGLCTVPLAVKGLFEYADKQVWQQHCKSDLSDRHDGGCGCLLQQPPAAR
jgi:hypothetical protein